MIRRALANVLGLIEGAAVAAALLGGWMYLIDYFTH